MFFLKTRKSIYYFWNERTISWYIFDFNIVNCTSC